MKHLALTGAAIALGLMMTASLAPATVGEAIASAHNKGAAKRAAIRAKRIECRQQADAQKMRFIKRSRFLRSCNRH